MVNGKEPLLFDLPQSGHDYPVSGAFRRSSSNA